jgi:hypothetical protein
MINKKGLFEGGVVESLLWILFIIIAGTAVYFLIKNYFGA